MLLFEFTCKLCSFSAHTASFTLCVHCIILQKDVLVSKKISFFFFCLANTWIDFRHVLYHLTLPIDWCCAWPTVLPSTTTMDGNMKNMVIDIDRDSAWVDWVGMQCSFLFFSFFLLKHINSKKLCSRKIFNWLYGTMYIPHQIRKFCHNNSAPL